MSDQKNLLCVSCIHAGEKNQEGFYWCVDAGNFAKAYYCMDFKQKKPQMPIVNLTGTIHRLKTWPEYFRAVKSGEKTFELRENDRNYQVGDQLILEEYDPLSQTYTGYSVYVTVTYILKDTPWLRENQVIMSIVKEETP